VRSDEQLDDDDERARIVAEWQRPFVVIVQLRQRGRVSHVVGPFDTRAEAEARCAAQGAGDRRGSSYHVARMSLRRGDRFEATAEGLARGYDSE